MTTYNLYTYNNVILYTIKHIIFYKNFKKNIRIKSIVFICVYMN